MAAADRDLFLRGAGNGVRSDAGRHYRLCRIDHPAFGAAARRCGSPLASANGDPAWRKLSHRRGHALAHAVGAQSITGRRADRAARRACHVAAALKKTLMLSCENLLLHYPGKLLCRDLSLEFKPGKCWGILGQNGSGKTTLMQALSGLHEPAGGSVALNGRLLRSYSRRQLGRALGVLLQEEDSWFWGSVFEYVLLGRHPHVASLFGWSARDEELAWEALKKMELADLAQRQMN